MNDEVREQVALARYKAICPILAEPTREQNKYLRTLTKKDMDMPHYGRRRYGLATFKSWLKRYRRKGFEGLKPKSRADCGRPRKVTEKMLDAIAVKCRAFPEWSIMRLHEDLAKAGLLGEPPITYNTLVRIVRQHNLKPPRERSDVRKRYEAEEFGALWVCDFMHAYKVRVGKKLVKAILCAIIDDHSRMIVGYAFSTNETISSLTSVLKEAFMTYGIPLRFYVDNGSAFSSDLLLKACAQASISLIHSKPYDSPSRGKIERFFRTVRDRFLCEKEHSDITLDELNQAFAVWLKNEYHHRHHSGIDMRPIDRYHASAGRVDLRRLSKDELDAVFLMRHERTVNNDATISFKGRIYEVPAAYIRKRVEIRHPVDDDHALVLYDNDVRIARLNLVDVKENGKTFTPSRSKTSISYATGEVR